MLSHVNCAVEDSAPSFPMKDQHVPPFKGVFAGVACAFVNVHIAVIMKAIARFFRISFLLSCRWCRQLVLIDKLRLFACGSKVMVNTFNTVKAACGNVSIAVFLKAVARQQLSDESYLITHEVFVLGYHQAAVARHADVSRQRVHSVCLDLLKTINIILEKKR